MGVNELYVTKLRTYRTNAHSVVLRTTLFRCHPTKLHYYSKSVDEVPRPDTHSPSPNHPPLLGRTSRAPPQVTHSTPLPRRLPCRCAHSLPTERLSLLPPPCLYPPTKRSAFPLATYSAPPPCSRTLHAPTSRALPPLAMQMRIATPPPRDQALLSPYCAVATRSRPHLRFECLVLSLKTC